MTRTLVGSTTSCSGRACEDGVSSRAARRRRTVAHDGANLDPADRALVDAAAALIRRRFVPDRHHLAAALRTAAGKVYTALNLDTYVGRCALCAEAAVVAKAVSEGDVSFDSIVATRWLGNGEPQV